MQCQTALPWQQNGGVQALPWKLDQGPNRPYFEQGLITLTVAPGLAVYMWMESFAMIGHQMAVLT